MAKKKPHKGLFQKGNQLSKGKGRKTKLVELREYEMLRKTFNSPKLQSILDKIYDMALEGDTYCLKFVAERFFPAEYMADKLAGEETSSLDTILIGLKEKYIEAEIVE